MFFEARPTVFVLAATDNGTMIVSNLDWEAEGKGMVIGVASELFNKSQYEATEIEFLCTLLDFRRTHYGPGVMAIDGGANIGCYTIPFARHMTGWGHVLAAEPQQRVFYALAGNVAINNCFNVDAHNIALGRESGTINVPRVDYTKPRNLGGVRMGGSDGYSVPLMSIDGFGLPRLDLMKLDLEGMELDALDGARETIARFHPIIHAEHIICGERPLRAMLETLGYDVRMLGMNVVCIHDSDPIKKQISFIDSRVA